MEMQVAFQKAQAEISGLRKKKKPSQKDWRKLQWAVVLGLLAKGIGKAPDGQDCISLIEELFSERLDAMNADELARELNKRGVGLNKKDFAKCIRAFVDKLPEGDSEIFFNLASGKLSKSPKGRCVSVKLIREKKRWPRKDRFVFI